MYYRKISAVIIIFTLSLASVLIFNSGCFISDDETRVTINLQRNDLGFNNYIPEKRLIDRVLEFFTTPGYAMSWDAARGDLTLKVRSASFSEMSLQIPSDAETYTLVVPAVNNVTFEITSITSYGLNWGGHITLSLTPGEQDITIRMIPITKIISINDNLSGINISWDEVTYTDSYKIYRSSEPDGQYSYIDSSAGNFATITNTSGMVPGGTYYYRISVVYTGSEGVMCPPFENYWEGIY